MKALFQRIREKPKYLRYLIMAAICLIFYAVISLPVSFEFSENARSITTMAINLSLFCFALIYGFLSAEIADSVVIANLFLAVAGGFYGAFVGNLLLALPVGDGGAFGAYFYCFGYFLRYSIAGFFVSLVIKNTR